MFNKILVLPILLIAVVIIIIVALIVNRKKKKIRESFDGPCSCNNNYWDNYFKIVDKGSELQCNTSGCDPSDQTRLNQAWDSKKINAMIPYFDSFNNIINGADFNYGSQDQYKNYLDDYKSKVTSDYNMIVKINSSGWGSSSSSYKTEYDNRWTGVSNVWSILNDLISSYDLIMLYFKSDITVFDSLNYNNDFKPLRDRFYDYRYDPTNHSDIYSQYGNQHYSRNDNFWKIIYYTYYNLVYLGDLILYYQANPRPSMGTLRDHLNGYYDYFSGKQIAAYNVDNIDKDVKHIYKYFKRNLDGYSGNRYIPDGVVGDSEISDTNTIAQKERTTAYNNYFYETLGNCNNLYNDTVDNWPDTLTRFDDMNESKSKLGESLFTNNISSLYDAVNYTKGVFWDDSTGTWRPNQEDSNYSYCNPIREGQISNDTSNVDIYNFKNESDTAELRRKKIQYSRKDVYSSMYGQDVESSTISERLPSCPTVINQEGNDDISSWSRADDSNQDSICIQKNSFEGEPTSYKIGNNTSNLTTMKPGYLQNGKDIWLDNYEKITQNTQKLQDVTGNSIDYNNRDEIHTDLLRQAGVFKGEILKDRDWRLSTYEWKNKKKLLKQSDTEYFIQNYLPMFNNFKFNDTSIY